MNSARLGWNWATDGIYTSAAPLPPVQLVPHEHVCPDGTEVRVTAQYLPQTGVTLYRWTVGGQRAAPTSTVGPATVPPDWSTVDREHSVTEGTVGSLL